MRFARSLLVLCAFVSPSLAQPLADRVPGDAVVYVGWRGTADPGAAFKGTRLETMTRQSPFAQLIDQSLPAAIKFAQQKKPEWQDPLQTVGQIAPQLIKYPSAFFFVGPDDQGKDKQPLVKMGFLSRAGADSAALLAELNKLVQRSPKEWKAKAFAVGDIVSIVFGYDDDKMALAGEGDGRPAPLAANETYKAALAKVNADPTAIVFVSGKALNERIEKFIETRAPNPEEAAQARTAIAESGVGGVRSLIWTGAFAGRDWEERCFVDSPAPRKGLLTLLEGKPFNADLLQRVPANATLVQAQRLDIHKLVAETRRVLTAVDPKAAQTMDQGLGIATLAVGKNIEGDILEPLGDEWVAYSAPEIGGESLAGVVIINKLDNALKARLGLSSLSIFMSSVAVMATNSQDFKLNGRMIKVDDLNVYYFSSPTIAPAWTVKDGYLYAGFYPQTVAAAAKYAGKSLADEPKFTEAIGRLEQSNINGFTYIDVPQTMPKAYTGALAITRTLLGAVDMAGGQAPEMMLPTLPTILKESTPAGAVIWTDDAGLNGRGLSPFPGAALLARATLVADAAGPLAGILVPGLEKARQDAQSVQSLAQLRTIGLGVFMYAADKANTLPPSLATLYEGLYIQTPLRSPFAKPGSEDGGYVYLGTEVKIVTLKNPAEVPLAYDAAMIDSTGRVGVVYADGHVTTSPASELPALLKKAREAGLKAD